MNSKKRKIISIFLIILFFFFLNFFAFSEKIKDIFYNFSKPIQKVFWQGGEKTASLFSIFFNYRKLKEERDICKLDYQKLLFDLAELQDLRKENISLRKALGLSLEKEFKLELVRPLSFSQNTILVNKGKDAGLSENLPVITPGKVLLGKILKVYSKTAQVQLLFHPGSSFLAKILGKETSGLIKGNGSFTLSFENLPKEKEISKGDVVISSSLGGDLPDGLLVGEISEIQNLDAEPFQKAKVQSFFDFQKVDYFFVIKEF